MGKGQNMKKGIIEMKAYLTVYISYVSAVPFLLGLSLFFFLSKSQCRGNMALDSAIL